MFYVYLLLSKRNGKTYVGYTSKLPDVRLAEHNEGSNEFTRHNGPWALIYYESFLCAKCARAREVFFKTGVGKRLRKVIVAHF